MIRLADQQDVYHLVIDLSEHERVLERTDVLARFRVTKSGTIPWKYLRHETWERPTLGSDWEPTGTYELPRLTSALRQRIRNALQDEISSLLLIVHEEGEEPEEPDPGPKIDRHRFWSILFAGLLSRMTSPLTVQDCVVAIKKKSGKSTSELAGLLFCTRPFVLQLESGHRSLSATTALRLANIADKQAEWKVAQFLRNHALIQRHKSYERGGPR